MKRKCEATGPHHNDPCTRGKVWCPNANYKQDCDHCHGTGEGEDHRASTPITPDGLRRLGFNDTQSVDSWWLNVGVGRMFIDKVRNQWEAFLSQRYLGKPPDLEWVAAMIGLLKRANGEGV